jgi:hypothetical protein
MHDQICEYLDDNLILSAHQFDFVNLIQLLRLFWIARKVGTLISTGKCLIWLYYWI